MPMSAVDPGSLNGMTNAPSWFDITAVDAAKPLRAALSDQAPANRAAHSPKAQHWGMEVNTLILGAGREG